MFNRLLNSFFAWRVRVATRKYHRFPPDRTAILLVNTQIAFMGESEDLARQLGLLTEFARENGFRVIHAPMSTPADTDFPSPAHVELDQLLRRQTNGAAIPAEVGPLPTDVVLPARRALSAFAHPRLADVIGEMGIEHLVLAGPLANVTLDSTLRDAAQRDCHITVLSDCVAANCDAALRLELECTMPRYAHLITSLRRFKRLASR